jgi:hypothetical protein
MNRKVFGNGHLVSEIGHFLKKGKYIMRIYIDDCEFGTKKKKKNDKQH